MEKQAGFFNPHFRPAHPLLDIKSAWDGCRSFRHLTEGSISSPVQPTPLPASSHTCHPPPLPKGQDSALCRGVSGTLGCTRQSPAGGGRDLPRPHLQGCAHTPLPLWNLWLWQTKPPAVSATGSWHLSRALINTSTFSLHWQQHSSKLSQSKCILHSFKGRTHIHILGLILLCLTKKIKTSIQLSFMWPSNSPALPKQK